MPDTSKITAYFLLVRDAIVTNVAGIVEEDVAITGRHSFKETTKRAMSNVSGQGFWIGAIAGKNPDLKASIPQLRPDFQIQIYDRPEVREGKAGARHPYELLEDIIRETHGKNLQNLTNACGDTYYSGFSVEYDNGRDVYVIQFQVDLSLTN